MFNLKDEIATNRPQKVVLVDKRYDEEKFVPNSIDNGNVVKGFVHKGDLKGGVPSVIWVYKRKFIMFRCIPITEGANWMCDGTYYQVLTSVRILFVIRFIYLCFVDPLFL